MRFVAGDKLFPLQIAGDTPFSRFTLNAEPITPLVRRQANLFRKLGIDAEALRNRFLGETACS
jgi:hypothetical protein